MGLTDSLVAYWKLDETSGPRSDSRGSNTLADNNTVGFATGKLGNAADFIPGNSEYLSIADNGDLSMGDIDFTIQAWVWLDDNSSVRTILSKYGSGGSLGEMEYLLRYHGGNSVIEFRVGNGVGEGIATAGSLSTGQWYHLIAWHDSVNDQVGLRVNDTTQGTGAWSSGVQNGTAGFSIGRTGDFNGQYWDGRVDSVGVWKRILTTQEKTNLYNSGNGLEYPFGDDSSPTSGRLLFNGLGLIGGSVNALPVGKILFQGLASTESSQNEYTYNAFGKLSFTGIASAFIPGIFAENAVLHWRFNEATGSATIVDATNRGNDLTSSTIITHDPTAYFSLGRTPPGQGPLQGLDGGIDACYFFNDTLTSGELNDLYNGGAGREAPFSGATNASSLLSKLLAGWKLGETGSTAREDDGSGNYDLTAVGSPANRSMVTGNGCDFNGTTQYIYHTDTPDLRFGNRNFTLTFWVVMDTKTPPNGGTVITFVRKWGEAFCPEFAAYYHVDSDRFGVDLGDAGPDLVNNGVIVAVNGGSPAAGTIYFFCVMYDANASTLTVRKGDTGGSSLTTDTLKPVAQPYRVSGPISSDVYGLAFTNSTTFNPFAQVSGYDAPGDHYAYRANTVDFNGGNQFWSLSFWLKLDDYTDGGDRVIIGKVNGSVYDWFIRYVGSSNQVNFRVSDGGGSNVASCSVTVTDNNWHLYCVTHTPGGNITISKDAGTRASTAVGFTPAATSQEFRVGSALHDVDGTVNLRGAVASITKWNYVLSTADEDTLYNGGAGLAFPFSAGEEHNASGNLKFNGLSTASVSLNYTAIGRLQFDGSSTTSVSLNHTAIGRLQFDGSSTTSVSFNYTATIGPLLLGGVSGEVNQVYSFNSTGTIAARGVAIVFSTYVYTINGKLGTISGIVEVQNQSYTHTPIGLLSLTGLVKSTTTSFYQASGKLFRILGVGPLKSVTVVTVSPPEALFLLQGPKFRELPPKIRPSTFAYDHQSAARGIFNPRHGAYIPEITARTLQKIKRKDVKPGTDLTGKIVVD